MHVGRIKNKILHNYNINNSVLICVDHYKYLGVEISDNLKWDKHLHLITKKASCVLRFIQRVLRECPGNVKEVGYVSLVRPLLEYCCSVWDPYEVGLIS